MPVHCNADNFFEMFLPVSFKLGDDEFDSLIGAWLMFIWLVLFLDKV